MPLPLLTNAWVTGRDESKRELYVRLPSTQATGIPVSLGYVGPADDLRVNQHPLPRIGTQGLVAFPYGDARNGIWLMSIYGAGNAAFMPNGDGRLRTEWTGEVEYMSNAGDYYHRYPDGSFLTLGTSTDAPTITRRVVNSSQAYENVEAPDSVRRSGTVSSKPFQFTHSSGVKILIQGNTLTVTLKDGSEFIIGADGAPDGLPLVSKLVSVFNAHTHPENGSPPSDQISASDIQSTILGVSK